MSITKLFSTPEVFSPTDLNIYRRAQLLNFWIIFSFLILLKTAFNAYNNLEVEAHSFHDTYRFYSRLIWCVILAVSYYLFKVKHFIAFPAWVSSLTATFIIGELAQYSPLHSAPLILLIPIIVFPLMGLLWGGLIYLSFAAYIVVILSTGTQVEGLLHPDAFFNNHMYALIIGGGAAWFLEYGRIEVIDKLHHSATRDLLTNCWNRNMFLRSLEIEIKKAEQSNLELTMIFFDIDHFKTVNDTHGHNTGDAVLADFAQIVSSLCQCEEVFARMGGEEFALLLPGANLSDATQRTKNILSAVRNNTFVDIGSVTASAGVTSYVRGQLPKDFIDSADTALYDAKKLGRDRLVIKS